MPFAAIHAPRFSVSRSGGDTGRVGLAAGEGEAEAALAVDQADGGKLRGAGAHFVQQRRVVPGGRGNR